jgi:hypothetical protein
MIIRLFDVEFMSFAIGVVGNINDKISVVHDVFGDIEIDSHGFRFINRNRLETNN